MKLAEEVLTLCEDDFNPLMQSYGWELSRFMGSDAKKMYVHKKFPNHTMIIQSKTGNLNHRKGMYGEIIAKVSNSGIAEYLKKLQGGK
jgi:hypothetical protein